jgi:hypothetical protein
MPPLDIAYFLDIGVANYQYINNFPPVTDAEEFSELLAGLTHCGYPKDNVEFLLDE